MQRSTTLLWWYYRRIHHTQRIYRTSSITCTYCWSSRCPLLGRSNRYWITTWRYWATILIDRCDWDSKRWFISSRCQWPTCWARTTRTWAWNNLCWLAWTWLCPNFLLWWTRWSTTSRMQLSKRLVDIWPYWINRHYCGSAWRWMRLQNSIRCYSRCCRCSENYLRDYRTCWYSRTWKRWNSKISHWRYW
jgi:hypothetical protein